jgi:predicted outer membrane repeat protein
VHAEAVLGGVTCDQLNGCVSGKLSKLTDASDSRLFDHTLTCVYLVIYAGNFALSMPSLLRLMRLLSILVCIVTPGVAVVVKSWKRLFDEISGLQQGFASYELSKDFKMGFASKYELINIGQGLNVTIVGDAVLDAFAKDLFFIVEARAGLVLQGLTFINGVGQESGYECGAIAIDVGATVSISNCTFRNNTSPLGSGGAITASGLLTATNCVFDGNSASGNGGGAVAIAQHGFATIQGCSFSRNSVHGAEGAGNPYAGGGAISILGGYRLSAIVTDCVFLENTAEYDAGAIWVYDASAAITSCTFGKNTAKTSGGAIGVNDGGKANITNCSFVADNTASPQGGGAMYVRGEALLAGNTFVLPSVQTIGHNDILRFTSTQSPQYSGVVTFHCKEGTSGMSVNVTAADLLATELPPNKEVVKCTPTTKRD